VIFSIGGEGRKNKNEGIVINSKKMFQVSGCQAEGPLVRNL